MDALGSRASEVRDDRTGRRVDALRRSPLFLLAVAVLCGLGLAAASITMVRAADDAGVFEFIHNEYLSRMARSIRVRREPVERRPAVVHVASPSVASHAVVRREHRHQRVARSARTSFAALRTRIQTRRTMCVRLCDGYVFPLGTIKAQSELPAHAAACSAACPGAATQLYTLMPGVSEERPDAARSIVTGQPYSRLATADLFRKTHVASCSCQGPDNIATRLPILLDPTLRKGDVVVDATGGAKVFDGAGPLPHPRASFADFRRSRALTQTARRDVDRLMGASQREAMARSFERSLQTRQASVREVRPPAGSGRHVRAYTLEPDAGTLDRSGVQMIRVSLR